MMLVKALLIALYAGLAGVDLFDGQLHFHRPVVTGAIVGLILGDFEKGLVVGAALELVFMGMVPLAGAQPPNVVIGGVLGTAFAILANLDPKVAVGLAVPFAVAVQGAITLILTVYAWFIHMADKYAEEGNVKAVEFINLAGMIPLFVFYAVVAFLPLYFGADAAKNIINSVPQVIMDGLRVAGGMMPAVGFAMLLKIMLKKEYIHFLILGFVLVSYFKLPLIAVAIIGIILAAYSYYNGNLGSKDTEKEGVSDGI